MYGGCTFTYSSDQCGNYDNVCDCYNREHSLPKSWFNDVSPADYDLGHIVPTDGKVNGMRSNYIFGEVGSGAATWGTGKLGNAKSITVENVKGSSTITTTITSTAFEPEDQYKGDFARMYMYMAVRYKHGNSNGVDLAASGDGKKMFNATDANYGLTDYSIALLMKWHRQDPVSKKEIDRNNGMQTVQGNRNPFIDYPDLAEYLWGNHAGETVTLASIDNTFGGEVSSYSISLYRNGETTIINNLSGSYTLPLKSAEDAACTNWAFDGWSTTQISETNTKPDYVTTTSSAGIIYAVYAKATISSAPKRAKKEDVTDDLTRATTGVTNGSTTYSNWSGKTVTSDAVYAGNSAGGNNAIQLRSNNSNSGIVTTASGGKAKKVTVTWHSETAAGRTLNIYGKNSAYSDATDLYSSSQGTLLGTIVKGTSTELTISGDYEYIGMRSSSGAMYLTSVSIMWSSGSGGGSTTYDSDPDDCHCTGNLATPSVTATPSDGTITLTWDNDLNATNGYTVTISKGVGYTTECGDSEIGAVTLSGSKNTCVITGLVNGLEYTTSVVANATSSICESAADEDTATPVGCESWADPTFTYSTPLTAGGGKVTPTIGAGYGTPTFISSNTSVLQVDEVGKVTPISAGTATITAQWPGDGTHCPKDVVSNTITVKGIVILTFNANYEGADPATATQNFTYGEAQSMTANSFSRTGYTFQGWSSSPSGSKEYDDGASITITTATTLYAVWQVNKHSVTFSQPASGGTFTVNSSSSSPVTNVDFGSTVTITITPTNSHFTVSTVSVSGGSGYVAVSGSGNAHTFTMPDEDVTVSVTMTEETKYTVNWYVNGNPTTEQNYAGEELVGIANPSIDCNGKAFQGWTATTNYSSDDTAPGDLFTDASTKTMPINGTSYYAVFATETTSGGGSEGWSETAITSLTSSDVFVIVGTNNSGSRALPNTVANASPSASSVTISAGKITATVGNNLKWNISGNNSEGFTFYPNGDSEHWLGSNTTAASSSNTNIRVGTANRKLWLFDSNDQLVTNDSYTDRYLALYNTDDFRGYTSASTSTTTFKFYKYSAGSTTTISDYTTSCAAPTEVTVTFHANYEGADPATATQTIPYNTATALTANSFSQTGYSFQGWATSPSGSKEYDDGASVTLTSNTHLYAVWQKNSHDVIFTPAPTGATVTINGQSTSPQSVEYGETVTIVITPDATYDLSSVTASGVSLSGEGNTRTFTMPDADVTVTVIMTPKPTYTIRFYNGESLIGSAQTVVSGNLPSVPSNPEACEGYTFVGWWTTALPASNTESHIWISDFTATGDQDYHAVYRHNEGGSGSGTESVTFSDIYTSNTVVEDISIAIGTHTSVTFTKGGSDTQFYTNGNAIRWYGGGSCVVASDAGNITGITFTFGSSDGSNEIEAEGYVEPTWTGEASSVTFTQSGTSGNRRIAGISVTVDGGGTAHYTSVFSCSGHTITVAEVEHGSGVSDKSRCDEGGTVTITLTADEGYECGGITTSPVVSTTETSECTYTFSMPDADITVTPVFTPKTPRTFTFEKGTGICATSTLTEAVWNGGVTLPTATANSGCDPEYVFAGWATAATAETEVRPTLYAAGTLYNGEETTLYAVYSQTTGGSASGFTLSYTHNDVTYYVAARTGSNTYMDASTDAADAARFSIVTSNDKKYLCWHGENDTYVHNSADNTTLKFTTDLASASEWTVTEEGTSITLRNSSSGRYFMFNTNQKDRFSSYASEGALTKGDAGTTVYNTNPSCICYSVNITYNANGGTLAEGCGNVVDGECERDWKLCDAPTREGYLFTNWKDQNGTLYNAGATVQDLRLSLTLTAQWIVAPYTVLFDAGTGTCVASLTEPSRGDGITLPKAEPSAACAEDWTFIGWSETALVGETNTTASIIGVAGTPYIPTANNVTLYAVYSSLDEGGATDDYTCENASTPEEGDYAILVAKSDDSFGLLTYGTTSSCRLAYTEAYNSLQTTISSPAATQIWHLSYDVDGYAYLYNANAGAYLAASGTNITYNANAGSAFVLTRDPGDYGDYKFLNNTASGSTNYYLGANKDYDFIRYYTSQTLAALNSITLYKGSTGTRYYATSPVCTACEDPEWSFDLGTNVVKTKGSAPFINTVSKVHESSGTVTYSSTNEAVATVDAAGEVTIVGTGITTITLRLTKAMPYCAAVLQYELEVKEPSIDIVGVTEDGKITIEHDLEGTITIDLSEGNTVSTGTAANDLFFSKYFEAASNMKLFAIFNGTGHDMDLTNIRVRCNCTTDGKWPTKTGDLGYVELRTISKLREQYPKLKIPSGTELIFWSNNKGSTSSTAARNTELRECITFTIGEMEYHYSDMEAMEIPNWFCLGDYTTFQTPDADGNNQFVFNGDDSMIMERYNPATGQWEAIDLFGAGTSADPADTDGLVEKIETKYIINGVSQELNDGTGFHELCTESIIPFSTNRYMLVRKNTVLDGMHAVASNTTSFATLCEEWNGTPVGGSADGYCRSGHVFSDIAEYDYAENYIDWTGINDDAYTVTENADGTVSVYFKTPLDLDARACSLLKIEVHDKDDDTKILATTEHKIPIVVKAGTHMTTDDLFKNQGEKCATCDVAILGSATLTKATDGATNDMPEVRDIYVYGGGQLIIPSGTHYRAHDLIMRMEMAADKVNVAVPNIQAVGSLSNQYGGAIRQQVRVGTNRFYQFAVPYPVRLEDVTFGDGRPAIYGEDFMIRYYDGESRAQNLGTASNWKNFEGTELQPGVGYTLAVAKKAGHEQRELIFPMADASLAEGEPATKTTAIHAWGDNTIRANHRGWNFLSNPYLTTYGQNHLDEDAGGVLTTGRLVEDPEHPGWWVNDAGTIPYVTLINGTRTDYTQERVALQDLPPFTTFFIQAGDDTHNSGEESTLTFNRDHRATSAPAYMRAEQKAPVTHFGVLLNGNNATDNCGMAIGEDYSAAYDMQADLSKEFGSAYSLKLYTLQEDAMRMAFLATHPDSLNKPVPVGVRMPANAEYTFSIDRRYHLGAFAHIYLTDNVTGQHTDLLEDTYSFAGTRSQNDARFSLFVVVKKDTPTGTDNLLNGIYAVGREGSVMLTGLPETADIYIYDMNGRLVLNRHSHGATSVTYHMPIGVYQIRIHSEGANALLRTIVH